MRLQRELGERLLKIPISPGLPRRRAASAQTAMPRRHIPRDSLLP